MAGAILFTSTNANGGTGGGWRRSLAATLVLEATALVLTIIALFCTPSAHGFPVPWSLVAITGALCTIASGSMPKRRLLYGRLHTPLLANALSHPHVVYIGNLSYPLYLCHWPILVLLRWNMPLDTLGNNVLAANIIAATAAFQLRDPSQLKLYTTCDGPLQTACHVQRRSPRMKRHLFKGHASSDA